MSALAGQLNAFWRLVTGPSPGPEEARRLFRAGAVSAETRLRTYRAMYRQRLGTVLEETHPRTRLWLGQERFVRLGWSYLSRHPSRSQAIEHVGEGLAPFLEEQGEPVAADLAALETARLDALLSPPDPPLAPIDPVLMIDSRLRLSRSVTVLTLRREVAGLWRVLGHRNDPLSREEREALAPPPRTEHLCVFRQGFEPVHEIIDAPEAPALRAALEGATLPAVCQVFSATPDPVTAAHAAIRRWMRWGILIGTWA
jgi:hypothetical protein